MNAFFNRETNGLIPELLLPGDVTSRSEFIGGSTAYFNAVWKYPFLKLASGARAFYLQDGSIVQVS